MPPHQTSQGLATLRTAGLLTLAVVAIVWFFATQHPAPSGNLKPPDQRRTLETFRLQSIGGEPWQLREHRGRVVLLNFWATWCPPCRAETPDLVKLAHRYETAGLHIAGISMDDHPASEVPSFVARYHIPYPILIPDQSFALASAVESLPTTILVDRQGRVARSVTGAVTLDDMAADIEQLLAEGQ